MTQIPEYQPKSDLMKDKIVIITGAGDGIGKALAIGFAKHGATVVLLGRTISKLEQVYDAIEANGSPTPAIYPIDFEGASEKDYQDMAIKIDEEFGKLDCLIHNAALLGDRTSISNYSFSSWDKLFKVNVTAPFLMTKALMPVLNKAEQSSVIFTSSSVGRKGRAFWGAYAASKAALENLVETLADENNSISNIRFNSINPGATRTAMRATAYPAEEPQTVKAPEALLPAYLYLAGCDSVGRSGEHFDATHI